MYNKCATISCKNIIKEEQIVRKEARSIIQSEMVDVENLKFGDVVKEWMLVKRNQVKESVFCNYEQKIRYYFKDFFFLNQ